MRGASEVQFALENERTTATNQNRSQNDPGPKKLFKAQSVTKLTNEEKCQNIRLISKKVQKRQPKI